MISLYITGNGRTFVDENDLTDETHDAILEAFEIEMSRPDLIRHDAAGKPVPLDGLGAAMRCTTRVRNAAMQQGWTLECAERLATVAGIMYGAILGAAATEFGEDR